MIIVTIWKCDFEKQDLQRIKHPRVTVVRFVGPSPCCGIAVRHAALITYYSDLTLGFLIWDSNS